MDASTKPPGIDPLQVFLERAIRTFEVRLCKLGESDPCKWRSRLISVREIPEVLEEIRLSIPKPNK